MPPRSATPGLGIRRERSLHRLGHRIVAGLDEAGRGPLAGPVVAAAVILDPARVPAGLGDSKALSPARREILFEQILSVARVGIASASPAEIDAGDIRRASLTAMRRALLALSCPVDIALIDGRDVPDGLPCAGEAVIKGDASVASIAAASIVAKVTRDRLMTRLDAHAPAYGFARHAGYPTAEHLAALGRHGPCAFHRMTFRPVRACLEDSGREIMTRERLRG